MAKSTREVIRSKDVAKVNIVAGAFSMAGHGALGGNAHPRGAHAAADYVQLCMVNSVKACHEQGITDPMVIRDAQRRAVKIAKEQLAEAGRKLIAEAQAAAAKADAEAKAAAAKAQAEHRRRTSER
jgi:hypothetical protein